METHREAHDPKPATGVSRILLILVRTYQWVVSPLLGNHCRFEPSCSQYAVEAIERWGALRGSGLATARICRCHPWGRSGYDPVPYPAAHPTTTDR